MSRWGWISANPARAIVFVILGGYATVAIIVIATHWGMADVGAYWAAAMRLREGQPLYIDGPPEAAELYRYAPWFAVAWIPLTLLPQALVYSAWGALTLAALGYLYWPLRSPAAIALGLLLLPGLLRIASTGNVEILMLSGLAFGLRRPSGPAWVALAASLKFVPLAFAAVYAAERKWRRAIVTLVLSALLWLPVLAFDLSQYPTGFGTLNPVWPWGAVLAAGLLLTLPRWRQRWAIATVAMAIVSPRGLGLHYFVLAPRLIMMMAVKPTITEAK